MFRVALDTFHGPLDLLLYLVKKDEVDVHELSLARLADQFLEHLTVVQAIDVEFAGEFLVTAATLMEIKSRALLPVEAAADDPAAPPDPRRELVKQLLEYRAFKDAAAALERQASVAAVRLPRTPEVFAGPSEVPVRPVELWDLVSAFARLMREAQPSPVAVVPLDDTPQEVYEREVEAAVRAAGRLRFADLFRPPFVRVRMIGLFLAVLELIKRQAVVADQPEPFGDIWLAACA